MQRDDDRAEAGEQRGPGRQAEVRVDDVEALAAVAAAQLAGGAPGSRAGRAGRRTARPRRRRAGAAPRPGRARRSPSAGRSGVGYMLVTTRARTVGTVSRAQSAHLRLDPSHGLAKTRLDTSPAAGGAPRRRSRDGLRADGPAARGAGWAAPRARPGDGRVRRADPADGGRARRRRQGGRAASRTTRASPRRSSRSSRARSAGVRDAGVRRGRRSATLRRVPGAPTTSSAAGPSGSSTPASAA